MLYALFSTSLGERLLTRQGDVRDPCKRLFFTHGEQRVKAASSVTYRALTSALCATSVRI